MRLTAIIIIVLALGVSGVTFYLVQNYLADQTTAQSAEVQIEVIPTVQVGVAAKDLPTGRILKSGDVKWQPWPDKSLDSAFIVQRDGQGAEQIDEFTGTVVRRGIAEGEPVTFVKVFRRDDAGFLAGVLTPGMRAVAIRVSAASSAAGFILPGDHVDVLLTQEFQDPEMSGTSSTTERSSETILHDIRVLAIDQNANDFETDAQVGKTATLEVTPRQAEVLSVATAMGNLSLALRSLTPGSSDYAGSYTSDIDVSLALGGGRAKPVAPQNSSQPSPSRNRATVKVYRSSEAESVRVNK